MSIEAIDEYLAIAKHCVTTQKPGGGVYGYPAILLLFSVVEALSNYRKYRKDSLDGLKDIFPALTTNQIRDIRRWYRNLLAHSAVIMPGTMLTADEGDSIEFGTLDEPTHIRVKPLYDAIKAAWDRFDKTTINPEVHPKQAPKAPITLFSPLPGASGSYNAVTVTTVAATQVISVTGRAEKATVPAIDRIAAEIHADETVIGEHAKNVAGLHAARQLLGQPKKK